MKLIRKALLFALIQIILVGLVLEASFGLMPYGLIGLIFLGFISSAGLGLLKLFKAPVLMRIFKWATLFFLPCIILVLMVMHFQEVASRKNADEIISRLNRYKAIHGKYPETLQKLGDPPGYYLGLRCIEFDYFYKESDKISFRYFANINSPVNYHYWLFYQGYVGVEKSYNSREKVWRGDD